MATVKRIYHIADIHVRLYRRHKEYQEVFYRLFDKIRELGTEDSVICILGDIVHAKTDISPEQISVVSELLTGCSLLCKTIVIPGNHDFNESNRSRLDALTPITNALNDPNIWYVRDSYVLHEGDVSFSHFSIWGDKYDWPLASEINSRCKVAMYHGPVNGARTDYGFDRFPNAVPINAFDGFDIVLLGDIHKQQFLGSNIAYPGSLIQQGYGESLDHGMLVWDVESREANFYQIPNDSGFFTVNVGESQMIPELPKNVKVRILHDGASDDDIQAIVDDIGLKSSIRELQIENRAKVSVVESDDIESDHVLRARDTDVQMDLLRNYYDNLGSPLSASDVRVIEKINNDFNSKLNKDDIQVRDVNWELVKFSFSNMFSYGSDNVIDFDSMAGIVGLFAPNASGKSTLLDALTFCIFDKCSKTFRASSVLNNKSDQFESSLIFKIGDVQYEVIRNGKRSSSGAVTVDVKFLEHNGDAVTDLSGKRRDETNKIIRDYIGTYDDFVLTTMSTQSDPVNFIDLTQKDRQELLYRFLDLSVYSELHRLSKEYTRDMQMDIKRLESENYIELVDGIKQDIDSIKDEMARAESEIVAGETKLKTLESDRLRLSGELPSEFVPLDINKLQSDLDNKIAREQRLESEIQDIKRRLEEYDNTLPEYKKMLSEVDVRFDRGFIEELREEISKSQAQMDEVSVLELEYDRLKLMADKLSTHEYDPDCEYCVRNQFVIDAIEAKRKLPEIQGRVALLKSVTEPIDAVKSKLDYYEQRVAAYDNLEKAYSLGLVDIETLRGEMQKLEADRVDTVYIMNRLRDDIKEYEVRRSSIEATREIEDKISRNKVEVTLVEMHIAGARSSRDLLIGKLNRLEYKLEEVYKKRDDLKQLREQYRVYELYENAVQRDGIPYMVLRKVLPIIESEVNRMLDGVVDFKFKLNIGEKDNIDAYIQYGPDKWWPVELVSGMERFMVSLAIRSSLVHLSILPKPNFLAIDEGFGVLDNVRLASIDVLFSKLKSIFRFVLCISHITEMRDSVDQLIGIDKVDGFSNITVE